MPTAVSALNATLLYAQRHAELSRLPAAYAAGLAFRFGPLGPCLGWLALVPVEQIYFSTA